MLQKPAILYVEKITCTKTTGEAGDDDVWLKITVDGSTTYYPSDDSRYHFGKDGGVWHVDLAINVTYANKVVFELIEYDGPSENENIGSHTLTRGSAGSSPASREINISDSGETTGDYTLTYRIISDPIPTLRVLGIRCEQQSAGMNVDLVEAIAAVASEATGKAGEVIEKSPRPRAKAIGKAFEAASYVLAAVAEIGEWIGRIIEGKYDEVYMEHVEGTKGYQGAFFPPGKDYEEMKSDQDIYFEEKYGHYFRFPLDRGPVTLQFREHDGGKADVNIGTLTVAPDSLTPGSSAGVSGTTVNGGVAVMDGPAVVELANCYGDRGGEGALYHICYSVGFEDWCRPATPVGQGEGGKPESGEVYCIVARHSGKVLTVSGDSSTSQLNGANIMQSEHIGSAKQWFRVLDVGQGYHTFSAWHSGKAIHSAGTPDAEGGNIEQYDYVESGRQLFKLEDQGDGYYGIISKHSGNALTVIGASQEDGANVEQWEFVSSAQQSFRFVYENDMVDLEPEPESPGVAPEPGKSYAIIAKHSRKAISVQYGQQSDGANVYQLLFLGMPRQIFTLQDQGDGYYSFIAMNSEKVLDVADASQENGANVQQWRPDQGNNQMFRLEDQGDGYYSIVAKHSGKVLDVAGASMEAEANIQQWEFSGGDNQLFKFIPLD